MRKRLKEIARILKIKLLGIGWKSKVIFKRATAYISINKLIVNGCNLEKGDELYSYLTEDNNSRKIIITYLDSEKQTNLKLRDNK